MKNSVEAQEDNLEETSWKVKQNMRRRRGKEFRRSAQEVQDSEKWGFQKEKGENGGQEVMEKCFHFLENKRHESPVQKAPSAGESDEIRHTSQAISVEFQGSGDKNLKTFQAEQRGYIQRLGTQK